MGKFWFNRGQCVAPCLHHTGLVLVVLLVSALQVAPAHCEEQRQICMYTDEFGIFHQVNEESAVPDQYRSKAKCIAEAQRKPPAGTGESVRSSQPVRNKIQTQYGGLARPEDVDLEGSLRRESMASSIGRIELRWPRKVESLFGRTPVRAMQDAARAVSKAVKQNGFPAHVRNLDLNWQVVFMDAEVPVKQIPSYLVSNCHPAWMVPPSSIYVVSQRVVSGCTGESRSRSVADARLAEVLIHELGHAIEYALIPRLFSRSRQRAEGFATWFEGFASTYSSVISQGAIKKKQLKLVRQHPGSATHFSGSAVDYARSALVFYAIEENFRVPGIMKVYRRMSNRNMGFIEAVKAEFSWGDRRLKQEVADVLEN